MSSRAFGPFLGVLPKRPNSRFQGRINQSLSNQIQLQTTTISNACPNMWLKIGCGELVRVVALLQQKPLIVERANEISGIADLKTDNALNQTSVGLNTSPVSPAVRVWRRSQQACPW